MRMSRPLAYVAAAIALSLLLTGDRAHAYVEAPHTLGRIVLESSNIVVMKVEKVDKERNLIVYTKVQDLKGSHPQTTIKHNIGKAGFHEREWKNIMAWAEPGKTALFFHNGSASETCIDTYWYQAYPGGDWWNHSHAEPYLLRSFAGKPEKLIPLIQQMLAGQEVLVPCMRDGDKNALQLRTAKIQRLKASLKIQDYDQTRDFAGWGGDEFRALAGMPGFVMYGGLTKLDNGVNGIASADIDGDGLADLCLFGEDRVALFRSAGKTVEEVSLPYAGGARSASFADWNGDGKVDLLLATPAGPKLLTNAGGSFKDETGALPKENYYNATAAAFIDFDGDQKPDVLLANGYLGLRLYRNNLGQPAPPPSAPLLGKWHYIGPFDNTGGGGFAKSYPPEKDLDLKKTYPGKNKETVGWKEGNFPDGQVNSLALFKPELHDNSAVYLVREIEVSAPMEMPISLGSDDTLTVWLNGEKLLAENASRAAAPDQNQATLKLKPGKNHLLLKVCNGNGEFAFYFQARTPTVATPTLFADVSDKTGLGLDGVGGTVKGDRLLIADVNADNRPDVLYSAPTPLLAINTASGFVASTDSGLSFKGGKITPAFGDFNADKSPDLFVPHPSGSKLFRNDGKGKFTDVTAQSGDVAKPIPHATAAVFADFSGGGKQDLLVACGKGVNLYFKNTGNGTFADSSDAIGLTRKAFGTKALAAVDLNKDGVLDLALANDGLESAVLLAAPR